MILRALTLAASPPSVWNLCRPENFFLCGKLRCDSASCWGEGPNFFGQRSSDRFAWKCVESFAAALGAHKRDGRPCALDGALGETRRGAAWQPTHFEERDASIKNTRKPAREGWSFRRARWHSTAEAAG